MRQLIERRMNLWLFMGCIAGLAWPYWDWVPDLLVKLILMAATFIACFKLNIDEFKQLNWRFVSGFIILRYTLVAWAIYYLSTWMCSPDVALAILLIAALPAGVSAPAMSHLFQGQVTLAATITIITTLIAPFTIPLLFSYASSVTVMPEPYDMLETLVVILVLPCVLFLLVGKYQPLKTNIQQNGKAATILLVSVMLAMVVGKQREFVLADMWLLVNLVILTFIVQALMLLIGWVAGLRVAKDQRIALAVSSGFNNAALGVALAALHFGPMVIVTMVAAEISWALLPYVMRLVAKT